MTNVQPNSIDLAEQKGTRPLRVLFYLFFPGSGIGRYTHELLNHLQGYPEIETELVCLPSYHWLDEATYPVWPGLREIAHRWPWRRRARFLMAQFANPMRLCKRVRRTQADIVHLCNINHMTHALWGPALRRTGAKVVATVHDVRRATRIINARYENRQLCRFYNRADALFIHGSAQISELTTFAGVDESRIHVVPHGPYDYGEPRQKKATLRRKYGIPDGKQVALFFGNIRDEKNLDLLLRAMVSHRSSLHLVVAGRGGGGKHKAVAFYRKLAGELGITDGVSFFDAYIPDDEVPDLLTVCDWMAIPYSQTFTSQSGVLNVAMQYRRPVLLSAAPTLAETIAQCDIGVSVTPDDVAALEQGVGQIQKRVDENYQHEFDEYSNRFGWAENAKQTLAVYRTLADYQQMSSTRNISTAPENRP